MKPSTSHKMLWVPLAIVFGIVAATFIAHAGMPEEPGTQTAPKASMYIPF